MTTLDRPSMISDETPVDKTVLLLSDDNIGQELQPQLAKIPMAVVDSPYDALEDLARHSYSAIILTGPREDFAGLSRALRKLGGEAKLLAFADPDAQATIREETGELIDRYCVYPPTRGEASSLVREFGPPGAIEAPLAATKATELESLILATQNLTSLEDAVTAVLHEHGLATRWEDTLTLDDAHEPLLACPAHPGRSLILDGPADITDTQDALIDNLYQMLPSLMRVAGRCESLHRLAITDHLTGAYNRRYFYHLTNHILGRAQSEGFRATLLLYDIDDFKRYNDQFGHAAGDDILRDTARMMKQICRDQDIVARIGGDEFAVLFWDNELRTPNSQPLRDIVKVADRFRDAVAKHHFPALGPDAQGVLTISGGLANFPEHGHSCVDLLQRADEALSKAKTGGKNTIRLVGQTAG